MSKRERLEDLGRIAEMLDRVLDNDIFDMVSIYRNFNDFKEVCRDEEKLEDLYAQIESIRDEIYEIHQIARWGNGEGQYD